MVIYRVCLVGFWIGCWLCWMMVGGLFEFWLIGFANMPLLRYFGFSFSLLCLVRLISVLFGALVDLVFGAYFGLGFLGCSRILGFEL